MLESIASRHAVILRELGDSKNRMIPRTDGVAIPVDMRLNNKGTSLSSQSLDRAIKVEIGRALCYGQWAEAFRRFDSGIAKTFDMLADEEWQHLTELRSLSAGAVPIAPCSVNGDPCRARVTDDEEAVLVLREAIALERESSRLYRDLAAAEHDVARADVYRRLAEQEDAHEEILTESLDRFELSEAWRDSA